MGMVNQVEWGKALKIARESRGLSVQQAAAIHGASESTWNNWEAGVTKPHGRLWRPVVRAWPEVQGL